MVEKSNTGESAETEPPKLKLKKKLPFVLLSIWISGWVGTLALAYMLLFSDRNYPTVFFALWMGLASMFFILPLARLLFVLFRK